MLLKGWKFKGEPRIKSARLFFAHAKASYRTAAFLLATHFALAPEFRNLVLSEERERHCLCRCGDRSPVEPCRGSTTPQASRAEIKPFRRSDCFNHADHIAGIVGLFLGDRVNSNDAICQFRHARNLGHAWNRRRGSRHGHGSDFVVVNRRRPLMCLLSVLPNALPRFPVLDGLVAPQSLPRHLLFDFVKELVDYAPVLLVEVVSDNAGVSGVISLRQNSAQNAPELVLDVFTADMTRIQLFATTKPA
jgi:hypothetical protein